MLVEGVIPGAKEASAGRHKQHSIADVRPAADSRKGDSAAARTASEARCMRVPWRPACRAYSSGAEATPRPRAAVPGAVKSCCRGGDISRLYRLNSLPCHTTDPAQIPACAASSSGSESRPFERNQASQARPFTTGPGIESCMLQLQSSSLSLSELIQLNRSCTSSKLAEPQRLMDQPCRK